MKYYLFLALLLISMNATAQSDFDRSIDSENNAVVFKGQLVFDDLSKEASFDWFAKNATAYHPQKEAIAFLKKELAAYELVIFLGTWCDDSHQLIPKLYATLQAAQYPTSQYKMYGVDRAKTTKYIEHQLYQITFVPTILVYKNNQEVGRIVEATRMSIEEDLAAILQKDMPANK